MESMCGADFLSAGGQLSGWDITAKLDQITVPTQVIRGEYDEVSQVSQNPRQAS